MQERLIKKGGDGLFDLALRFYYFSEDPMMMTATAVDHNLWQDRYILAAAIFYLKDLSEYGEHSYETIRSNFSKIYKETANADGKSPLFDTDNDGYFDTADAFPLNEHYHTDTDRDAVPDELDYFPMDPTQYLGVTTLYQMGFNYWGHKYGLIENEDGSRTLWLRVCFDSKKKGLDFEKWEKEVNRFLNERIPESEKIQIRVEVATPWNAHYTVKIEKGTFRENSERWSVDMFHNDIPGATHEIMHLFGLPDRYHEIDVGQIRDHTFTPGKDLLVDNNDLMRNHGKSSKIDLRDIRLLAAESVLWPEHFANAVRGFGGYWSACDWLRWTDKEDKEGEMTQCVLSKIDEAIGEFQRTLHIAPPAAKVLIEEKITQARQTKEDEALKKPGTILAKWASYSLKVK